MLHGQIILLTPKRKFGLGNGIQYRNVQIPMHLLAADRRITVVNKVDKAQDGSGMQAP